MKCSEFRAVIFVSISLISTLQGLPAQADNVEVGYKFPADFDAFIAGYHQHVETCFVTTKHTVPSQCLDVDDYITTAFTVTQVKDYFVMSIAAQRHLETIAKQRYKDWERTMMVRF